MVEGPAAGGAYSNGKFRVLYIDDDKTQLAMMERLFKPASIDQFARKNIISPEAIELLRRVTLVTVHNDAQFPHYAPDAEIPMDVTQQKPAKGDPREATFEKDLTPLSRASRDIYDGKYDLVITDKWMPGSDAYTNRKYKGRGGMMIANVARLAHVPVIVHSSDERKETLDDLTAAYQLVNPGATREAHKEQSEAVATPGKLDAAEIYQSVAAELEKLAKQPEGQERYSKSTMRK